MQRYMTLSNDAVMSFHRGDHRESANKYIAAVKIAPHGPWTENRFHIFDGYTSILTEQYFPPSDKDFKILRKDFLYDEVNNEPALFRVEAALTLGLMAYGRGNRQETADYYREGISVAESATQKERKRQVMLMEGDPNTGAMPLAPQMHRVGSIIDRRVARIRRNLDQMENPRYGPQSTPQQKYRSDGTLLPSVSSFKRRYMEYPELNKRLDDLGGRCCDNCGKTKEQAGLSKTGLLLCTRCKLSYYCSKECQRMKWKNGHKHACRKPGQIEIGDYMLLHGLTNQTDLNDTVVRIEERLVVDGGDGNNNNDNHDNNDSSSSNSSSRWKVYVLHQRRCISVSSERLKHIRPEA